MKGVIYLIVFTIMASNGFNCYKEQVAEEQQEDSNLIEIRVVKIDKVVGEGKFIYLLRVKDKSGKLYKIISYKDEIDCHLSTIKTNETYHFDLVSAFVNISVGSPLKSITVYGVTFSTEPKNGITDLHHAKNLNGLCLLQ